LIALKVSVNNPVNLKQALSLARGRLGRLTDIEDPAFEAEVLLRYVLKLDRAQLHLSFDRQLTPDEDSKFFTWVKRRLSCEPTAYILQNREFFGLDFYVDTRVLIPRPESELLVEEALKFAGAHKVTSIADIGTGSGALAISLAVSLFSPSLRDPQTSEAICPTPSLRGSEAVRLNNVAISTPMRIFATDISPDALEVAKFNAKKHNVKNLITFLQGDLLDALPQPMDILIANLPYVTTTDISAMPSAKYEPLGALDGGADGLDQIRRLAKQLKNKINPGGLVLLEIGMGQGHAVSSYFRGIFPEVKIEFLPDLAGIDRVVKVIF